MKDNPLLSVVVTSYTMHRLTDIFELLDSVAGQDYANIETVFVAERSLDLMSRVEEYVEQRSIPDVRVVFNNGAPGLSAARNVGIGEAKGDIIAFVDDDVVLFPDWAQEMVKAYADESVIGITGPAYPLWEEQSMSWFPKQLYWVFSCTGWSDWTESREVRNAWGMNMSFAREAFDQCGLFRNEFGFHKGPIAEDNEFSMRVRRITNKRIVYSPHMKLWHRVHRYRLSYRFIRERAYWIGRSRRNLKRLYSERDSEADLLDAERGLLKRIVVGLVPQTLRDSFRHPILGWRKLSVTAVALAFVALGYYAHLVPRLNSQPELAEETQS